MKLPLFSSMVRLLTLLSIVAISNGLLTACETTVKVKDKIFKPEVPVTLIGSPTQNLDEKGAPLSIVVRLYALKSKDQMERVNMRTLLRSEQETLGPDLVSRQEIVLHPGKTLDPIIIPLKDPERPKNPKAEYIAVVAFFRKPDGDTWRQVLAVKDAKGKQMEITVQERSLKLKLE